MPALNLTLEGAAGERLPTIRYNVNVTTPLRGFFSDYARRNSYELESLRFTHSGDEIPTECPWTAAELNIDEGNGVIHVSQTWNVEAGERLSVCMIDRDTMPMSRLFSDFAGRSKRPLASLQFSHKGNAIPQDCPETTSQLNIEEGNFVIHVAVVPTLEVMLKDLMGTKHRITINRTTTTLHRLFMDYAKQKNQPVDHFRFIYGGKQLPPCCKWTAVQVGIDEDNNVIHVVSRLTRGLAMIDGAGDEFLCSPGRKEPLCSVFKRYAEEKKKALEYLLFTHEGKVIPTASEKMAMELRMDRHRGHAVLNVATVEKISIYFVYEDGDPDGDDRWEIQADPNSGVHRLFDTYSKIKGLGPVRNRLRFKYKGQQLEGNCNTTLFQLGVSDGDTVYATFHVPIAEELQVEMKTIRTYASGVDCHPRCLVNLRVARNLGEESVYFGSVVRYDESETGTVWTSKYPQGGDVEYSRDELIEATLYYYEVLGFEQDIRAHFKHVVHDLHSEVSSLKQTLPHKSTEELLLQGLKLEQDLDRLLLLPVRWIDASKLPLILKELRERQKSLVENELKCRAKSPILETYDEVYAKWRPNGDATRECWERGLIESFQCFEDTGYGPRREYCVSFDNGDVQGNIAADNVMRQSEYRLVKDYSPTKWKGVKRSFDEQSSDPWAKNVGWFVVNIDGIEQPFACLDDALNAHDASTLHRVGPGAKDDDLNFAPTGLVWSNVSESEARGMLRLRIRLLIATELISNPDMKHIGKILSDFVLRHMGRDCHQHALGFSYKEASRYYYDCEYENIAKMKDSMYRIALHRQCVEEATNIAQLCLFFIAAKGNIDRFFRKVPIVHDAYEGYASALQESDWGELQEGDLGNKMRSMWWYLKNNKPTNEDNFVCVKIVDKDSDGNEYQEYQRFIVSRSSPLKGILTEYAGRKGVPVRALRIEYDGSTVFLSTFGKQTSESLGLKDSDVKIKVAIIQQPSPESSPKAQRTKPKPPKSKGKGKKSKSKRKKRTQQPTLELPVDDETKMKAMWFDSISRVFAEADPQFRDIRQRLNALSLQRTEPKQRKVKPKKELEVETVANPPTDGLGGKAGKSYFVVLVGEETNLYKTRKQSALQIAREIDLHGLAKEEALAKLNECLPKWVDTAMKGEHPWVIAVRIVCGGGSQTLAEAVEQWIRRNANVSNAPKSLYC